jgi:hypothetical protein
VGWTYAGTPLNAISRANWNAESAEVRTLLKAPRKDGLVALVFDESNNQSTINCRKQAILNGLRMKLRDWNEFRTFSA